ncbi:hypothetical protein PGT21_022959 [Puccinia graminis f. sp. tritici]|uniref:Hydrophobin n=2 Tax=Puccinia graminis f. sp. tritici TaxID=56615 RepID=E3K2N8_PUCGT|nr:uncharacterized protein PGTG_04563 [Puccinia graminis f. sp. tritici CRL 75-36-700-3]EFP78607.2 hypothetical protein PGTG_04563 [Puccinia graminis f. sp. tritici CRL 75-36-700-3]KAA1066955.1 hypothetical protein PGTUg99_019050 [Puccinia graminis f. sp. tritici]KAA1083922.1 hypothetical protein PGT21_011723 [Puccinia graminis f. sp. tritici]KAA1119345.1 hypothetical protein PGT21_022959 [Puccinia graminis f. sp. tritici]
MDTFKQILVLCFLVACELTHHSARAVGLGAAVLGKIMRPDDACNKVETSETKIHFCFKDNRKKTDGFVTIAQPVQRIAQGVTTSADCTKLGNGFQVTKCCSVGSFSLAPKAGKPLFNPNFFVNVTPASFDLACNKQP